jgi:hypothetical protein
MKPCCLRIAIDLENEDGVASKHLTFPPPAVCQVRTRRYLPDMSALSNFVSLHPYFKVHPEKLDAVKAGLPRFVEKTATEKENLFYGFTVNGDEVLCREAYTGAEGVLAHLDNVGALLAEMLTMADLTRVEVHGPAAELDKLRKPLAHLHPKWFVVEAALKK